MRRNIAEGISDSFEDAMNSYYESAPVKDDAHKFNTTSDRKKIFSTVNG